MLFMYVDNNIEYWIESDGEINEDVNIGEISHIPPPDVPLDEKVCILRALA